MKELNSLKRIFASYKADVDALGQSYARESASDARYNDTIRAERTAERNADYNARIDTLAAKAQEAATAEIEALEGMLGGYIAAGDADRLTKLQTIAAAGLELSPIESDSLAAGASYLELRLLERITSGRIKAPSLTVFEQDLKDLRVKASGLQHYRGSLAAINPGTGLFGGVSGKTGLGAGMSSLIAGNWLSAGLDEMTQRWATLETRE